VAQLVGGIIGAGANQPVTDHPQATLAAAWPADPNAGAGDKDAQANPHGGAPFSCWARCGHGVVSVGVKGGLVAVAGGQPGAFLPQQRVGAAS